MDHDVTFGRGLEVDHDPDLAAGMGHYAYPPSHAANTSHARLQGRQDQNCSSDCSHLDSFATVSYFRGTMVAVVWVDFGHSSPGSDHRHRPRLRGESSAGT